MLDITVIMETSDSPLARFTNMAIQIEFINLQSSAQPKTCLSGKKWHFGIIIYHRPSLMPIHMLCLSYNILFPEMRPSQNALLKQSY